LNKPIQGKSLSDICDGKITGNALESYLIMKLLPHHSYH